MSDCQEQQERVPKPLWPMLKVRRKGWATALGTDIGGNVHSVLFQYGGQNKYTLSVEYAGIYGVKPFMVGHKGLDYGFFGLLKEALELIERLFPEVEAAFHWDEIANFGKFIGRYGIGRKMVTRLAEAFTTLEQLRDASLVDIEDVHGIGKKNARLIADHFSRYVCFRKW